MACCDLRTNAAYVEDVQREITDICQFDGHHHYGYSDCAQLVDNWEVFRCRLMLWEMGVYHRSIPWRETHYRYAMRTVVKMRLAQLGITDLGGNPFCG